MKTLKTRIVCLLLTLILAGQLAGGLTVSAADGTETKTSIPKLLLIGNSYSSDVMKYLNEILLKEGVTDFTLGYLYYPGCSLSMHLKYGQGNEKVYDYHKSTGESWKTTKNSTLLDALKDEPWDVIYLQQAPIQASYSYGQKLYDLIDFVNANKTNPSAQFGWHMTWAYAARYATAGLTYSKEFVDRHQGDPVTMFRAIAATVQSEIQPRLFPAGVVPAGTAVQNARTSYFGDALDRDGYHLNTLGRVVTAYTWFSHLTGRTIDTVTLELLELNMTESDREVIRESVNNAIAHPYEITRSKYLTPRAISVTGGAAEVDGQQVTTATDGQQVSISFTMPSEMQFNSWKVSRGTVTLADPSSASTTFTMPDEDVEIAAQYTNNCPSKSYVDVSPFQWYHEAVDYVLSHGIMGGYNATTFGPDDNLSRAMIVQILYNYEKKPAVTAEGRFPDVSADQWYYNAVRWGADKGVVSGYGDGRFGPDDNVTVEQVAVILHNYAGKPEAESNLETVGAYDDWAADALRWCEATGILKNVPITRAIDTASRAQTAQMLVNYLNQ